MAVNYTSARFSAEDDNGRPLSGGRLYTYKNGTTTPAVTYKDEAGTTPNTNPIILDARGEAVVFVQLAQVYTFVLKNRNDALVWSQNGINTNDLSSVTGPLSLGQYLTGFVEKVVNSVSELRALSKTANTKARTLGYWTPGDQGAGEYYYDAQDVSSADNGGTVIVAADGGRWKLIYDGSIDVRQFGAKCIGSVFDDTQYVQAAINAAYFHDVIIPAGDASCSDLYFGTNSTGAPSVSPARLRGVGPSSVISARPGTGTLLSARNLAGVTIEDIALRPNGNVSGWVLDTDWTLYGAPSLNSIWKNIWIRGVGDLGGWTAGNNNDNVFHKCVIEGVAGKTNLSILAAGGAMKLDDVISVNGHIHASTQNLVVNGGYNFGFQFEGIINSTTFNNSYTYVNEVSGSCFWGGTVSMIMNGGLVITNSAGSLAATPGQGSVFDCIFNSDSTAFNVNYVGTHFGGGCKILGPNAASSFGTDFPIRLTLNGGTGESGTIIDDTDNAQVYIGTFNVRNYVGYSNIGMLNKPVPTKKGSLGAVTVPTASYLQIVPPGAVKGDVQGVFLLNLRIEVPGNPFRIMGTCFVPLLLKIGGTSAPVVMSTDAYLGGGREIRVRTSDPINGNTSPGIEISMNVESINASAIFWSLTKVTTY